MIKPIFQFGNVVVVDGDLIGVIVKSWGPSSKSDYYKYDVYVRSTNKIIEYAESNIDHFIYSKEITEDEMEFY